MFWLYAHIPSVNGLFAFWVVFVSVCLFLFVVSNDALTIFSSSECKNFETDWKQRNIDTTDLKTSVTAGTVVQIRCVGGHDN